ncbi:MAG: hypothetical protein HND59_11765 [Pseudomonadota bacterium]|nr:MAG: hypothetical protein HND59_11765 [Pseudomonadota bacterium]
MLTFIFLSTFLLFTLLVLIPRRASAHCDTEDGPAVLDGRKALQTGNANHALKWILPEGDAELRPIFDKAIKVRTLSADAADVADRHFLENLVRIHRAGEGASYDGIKPTGTVLDPEVVAADEAMETGNLKPLMALIPADKHSELQRRFDKARALKQFDVNDLVAGRAYVAAYVSFYKFAEGEEDHHHH